MTVVDDCKTTVDGLGDGHNLQDVGKLFKGYAVHSRSFIVDRLIEPGAGDGFIILALKSLRVSCAPVLIA